MLFQIERRWSLRLEVLRLIDSQMDTSRPRTAETELRVSELALAKK